MQPPGQARLEARREGKGGGGLQQPLPFVLALNAGPRATVALRDLWIQEQGEDKSRGRDTRGDQSEIGRTPAPTLGSREQGMSRLSQLRGMAPNRLGQDGVRGQSSTNSCG